MFGSNRRFIAAILFAGATLVTWTTSTPVSGQSPSPGPAAIDVTKLGPQVGEKVPDFSLPDQHGQARTLASVMGPKGLILVFNRSADW